MDVRERAAWRRDTTPLNAVRICDMAGDLIVGYRRTEREVIARDFVECDGAPSKIVLVPISQ